MGIGLRSRAGILFTIIDSDGTLVVMTEMILMVNIAHCVLRLGNDMMSVRLVMIVAMATLLASTDG